MMNAMVKGGACFEARAAWREHLSMRMGVGSTEDRR